MHSCVKYCRKPIAVGFSTETIHVRCLAYTQFLYPWYSWYNSAVFTSVQRHYLMFVCVLKANVKNEETVELMEFPNDL